jgi:phosphatidylserine synthase 2
MFTCMWWLCRRGLQQFTPATFEIFDWAIFSSPMRFVQALILVAMTLAFELNAFFLKTLLWIPPPHFINILRLLFLWLLALPAAKEYHEFLEVRASAPAVTFVYEPVCNNQHD